MIDTKFYLNDASASLSNFSLAPQSDDVKTEESENFTAHASANVSVGVLSESVYDASLVWWRAAMRKWIMRSLKSESAWIARIQVQCPEITQSMFLCFYRKI